ncbi:C-type lectin mosGCTL-1-like [Glandiceps talaboti]
MSDDADEYTLQPFIKVFFSLFINRKALQGSCKLALSPGCDCRIYYFYCEQSSANHAYYDKARDFCYANYDGLVRLESEQQHDAVINFITVNNYTAASCISNYGFWMGFEDTTKEGDFVWLESTVRQGLCTTTYSIWSPNEPNNNTKKNATGGQDCGQLWFRGSRNGKWDDEYCDFRPKGAVCEDRIPHCNYAEYGYNITGIPDCD